MSFKKRKQTFTIKTIERYWHDSFGPEGRSFIWTNINSSYQKIEHLDNGSRPFYNLYIFDKEEGNDILYPSPPKTHLWQPQFRTHVMEKKVLFKLAEVAHEKCLHPRHIADKILLAHYLVKHYDRKSVSLGTMRKIDVKKP